MLGNAIDEEKSKYITRKLSSIRVWPSGVYGYFKRFRVAIKAIVRHPLFDNFMTLCVLVNTITLALDRYGAPEKE